MIFTVMIASKVLLGSVSNGFKNDTRFVVGAVCFFFFLMFLIFRSRFFLRSRKRGELLVAGGEGLFFVVGVHLNDAENTNDTSDSPEDGSSRQPDIFGDRVHFHLPGNDSVSSRDEHINKNFLHERVHTAPDQIDAAPCGHEGGVCEEKAAVDCVGALHGDDRSSEEEENEEGGVQDVVPGELDTLRRLGLDGGVFGAVGPEGRR